MEMKMVRVLIALLGMMCCLNLATAANYTVGVPNGGWDQSTNLTAWASSQTFVQGDNLIFQYTQSHDVTEVSKADFDSCRTTNPVQPRQSSGFTVIPLTSAGSRYFICGRHCSRGMKVQIDTLATSVPLSSTTTPPPEPPPPAAGLLLK